MCITMMRIAGAVEYFCRGATPVQLCWIEGVVTHKTIGQCVMGAWRNNWNAQKSRTLHILKAPDDSRQGQNREEDEDFMSYRKTHMGHVAIIITDREIKMWSKGTRVKTTG